MKGIFIATLGLLTPAISLAQPADTTPNGTTNPEPKYHKCDMRISGASADSNFDGITKLSYTITTDGSVTDVVITQSSGVEKLDNAAAACVATWHYAPP